MARIVLGVTGGIAAYKSAQLIRLLTEAGHEVNVVTTQNATKFIGEATLEALSHNKVNVVDPDLFTDVESVKHINLGQLADLVIVAPATASFLAKISAGIADDLLTTTVLSANCKILLAPAMHSEMWNNAATISNVKTLSSRGFELIGPEIGRLTGLDSGVGRLSEPENIFESAEKLLGGGILSGKKVIVTAGGTREPIDAVRFIGNYSSGKQGLAFARSARDLGAKVFLITCNLELDKISGVEFIDVSTTGELSAALHANILDADLLIMAAAVSDFRSSKVIPGKLHRDSSRELSIQFEANPDVLRELVLSQSKAKKKPVFVGFAAEVAGDLHEKALEKLNSKGCDYVIANDVSEGKIFGKDDSEVLLVSNASTQLIKGSKAEISRECMRIFASKLRAL